MRRIAAASARKLTRLSSARASGDTGAARQAMPDHRKNAPLDSRFAKIADYGLIGDARTAALVSRFGSLDWCCFSHFDSPSSFAAIVDRERGGFFSICPTTEFSSQQRY